MSVPYWPNSGGTFQQLAYVSSTQALSIVPGGNTVFLNVTGGGSNTPNPTFSTIMMNGSLEMLNNTIELDSNGQSILYYNAGDNNTYLTGASTHTVVIGTQANPIGIEINDTNIRLALDTTIAGPTGLRVNNGIIASTLSVSSINGVEFPQPAPVFGAVGLSNFVADMAYIPGGNNAYPLSADFGIVNGHTYRISQNFAMSNGDNTGTFTGFAVSGAGAGFPLFINTFENSILINTLNGASQGIQTQFRANANGTAQVVAYNSANVSTLVQVQADGVGGGIKWLLEDLGAVL